MFGWRSEKDIRFKRVPDSEDSEELLNNSERNSTESEVPLPPQRGISWPAATAIVIGTSLLSLSIGLWAGRTLLLNADNFSTRHISQFSPIVADVGVKFAPIQFNGSLLASNVFRQDAGPEVDAAWKALGADYHAARVPEKYAVQSGLAPDQVKIRKKYGGGYPAHVEGLHHIHCLNLLRKSLAWNFEYYQKQGLGPFSNDADIAKHHITHCLDILRQQLMCTVDVGVLGQVWYQPPGKTPEAFVDFNTIHKCRNFDAIRDWAEKNQLPELEDTPDDFLEPPKPGDRVYYEVP